jgi:hypothetical protein
MADTTAIIIVSIFIVLVLLWLLFYGYTAFVRHARRDPPSAEAVSRIRRELRARKLAVDEARGRGAAASHRFSVGIVTIDETDEESHVESVVQSSSHQHCGTALDGG